jgi:hypothetical protein
LWLMTLQETRDVETHNIRARDVLYHLYATVELH